MTAQNGKFRIGNLESFELQEANANFRLVTFSLMEHLALGAYGHLALAEIGLG